MTHGKNWVFFDNFWRPTSTILTVLMATTTAVLGNIDIIEGQQQRHLVVLALAGDNTGDNRGRLFAVDAPSGRSGGREGRGGDWE